MATANIAHEHSGDLNVNDALDEEGQQHEAGASGRRCAHEEVAAPIGMRLVGEERRVEPGEPQPGADREDKRTDPAEGRELVRSPDEDEERRSDAEIHEVRERVEFLPEPRGGAEIARQAAVDAVQDDGDDEPGDREVEAMLERHADCRQARTETEERDEVGKHGRGGHEATAWPAGLRFRIYGGKSCMVIGLKP